MKIRTIPLPLDGGGCGWGWTFELLSPLTSILSRKGRGGIFYVIPIPNDLQDSPSLRILNIGIYLVMGAWNLVLKHFLLPFP